MEHSDLQELLNKGKEDGAKLYLVADALHKLAITVIAILAIVGLIAGFAAMQNAGFVAGVVVFALVSVLCLLLYAFDVIITNTSKVLVHILFANLAVVERKSSDGSAESSSDRRLLSPDIGASQEVIEGIKKTLAESGYQFVGEERTEKGIRRSFRGRSGSVFSFDSLDEMLRFEDIYRKKQ